MYMWVLSVLSKLNVTWIDTVQKFSRNHKFKLPSTLFTLEFKRKASDCGQFLWRTCFGQLYRDWILRTLLSFACSNVQEVSHVPFSGIGCTYAYPRKQEIYAVKLCSVRYSSCLLQTRSSIGASISSQRKGHELEEDHALRSCVNCLTLSTILGCSETVITEAWRLHKLQYPTINSVEPTMKFSVSLQAILTLSILSLTLATPIPTGKLWLLVNLLSSPIIMLIYRSIDIDEDVGTLLALFLRSD